MSDMSQEKIVIRVTRGLKVIVISSSHDYEVKDKETGILIEEGKKK